MRNLFLPLFAASELLFYLLIVQTGIVEYYHTDMSIISFIPIGGAVGVALNLLIKEYCEQKIVLVLLLQAFLVLLYPNLDRVELFFLGIAIGVLSPYMIISLREADKKELFFVFAIAYAVGTTLFTSDVENRGSLGILLSILGLVGYIGHKVLKAKKVRGEKEYFYRFSLLSMGLWAFLDFALFETLSRHEDIMAIWRGEFWPFIVLFHVIGVLVALFVPFSKKGLYQTIWSLFFMSYMLYLLQAPFALSLVYPFVISLYNVTIIRSLIRRSDMEIIVAMAFIGWGASGAGLIIALTHSAVYIPTFFVAFIAYRYRLEIFSNLQQIFSIRSFPMLKKISLSLMLFSSLFGASLTLQNGSIVAHTEVFGDSNIEPKVTKLHASLEMDDHNVASLHGDISFDIIDLISSNEKRDEHMRDMFEYDKYNKITLHIQKIELDKEPSIVGTLLMHGVKKSIRIPVEVQEKDGLLTLKSRFSVKVSDYGMEPPTLLFLSVRDRVDIKALVTLKEE